MMQGKPQRLSAMFGFCLSVLMAPVGAASGCGFDRLLGDSFSAMHPRSIAVAFAIRDAVDTGIVGSAALAPIVPGRAGYWRAVGRLNALDRLLSAASMGRVASSPISVLLINSGLWTRLSPSPQGFDIAVHTAGPQRGDVAIVTSEAILAAVLDNRLFITDALDRGLFVVDGEPMATDSVRQLIAVALDPRTQAATDRPVRMFGPVRE